MNHQQVTVVLPAYNAARTLARTVQAMDRTLVDRILLVDDASTDDTVVRAHALGLAVRVHDQNAGYGANQKTCYHWALEAPTDIIVMLHPDYQYPPQLVPALVAMIAYDIYDVVLGSRMLGGHAIAGGMPRYKYWANRGLTLAENWLVHARLSEYHTGFRAFRRDVLESINFLANSNDFVFDNQMLIQILAQQWRLGEISCPTHYAADSSSISWKASVRYGWGVLKTAIDYRRHQWHWGSVPYLQPPAVAEPADPAEPVADLSEGAGPRSGTSQ